MRVGIRGLLLAGGLVLSMFSAAPGAWATEPFKLTSPAFRYAPLARDTRETARATRTALVTP